VRRRTPNLLILFGALSPKKSFASGRTRARSDPGIGSVRGVAQPPGIRTIYRRLKDEGKPAKAAGITAAGKLVLAANATGREGLAMTHSPTPPGSESHTAS
jgi:hypothetical protein